MGTLTQDDEWDHPRLRTLTSVAMVRREASFTRKFLGPTWVTNHTYTKKKVIVEERG